MNQGLPINLEDIQNLRVLAEHQGADLELLRLREIERAAAELPPMIDGARLSELVATDPISTTWTAWAPMTGERLLIRCLHKRWCRDPVMQRRLQRDLDVDTASGLAVGQHWAEGEWVHNRIAIPGARLCEVLPHEPHEYGDSLLMTQIMVGGLNALTNLHRSKMSVGQLLPALIFFAEGIAKVAWLGRYGPPTSSKEDIAQLSETALLISGAGLVPVRQLAEDWASTPPDHTEDAGMLLCRAMATTLIDSRHRLWLDHRNQVRRNRIGRLAVAINGLQKAMIAPTGRVCLRADNNGEFVIAEVDERGLHGQRTTNPMEPNLKPVYTNERVLDPVATRVLLRAWALRHRGNETIRAQTQDEIGG